MSPQPIRFSGVVLTGGESSRMGRDKALIEVDGDPLVNVAVRALIDAGAQEVFTVGGDREALNGLGLAFVADEFPGQGPLGGIITGLTKATEDIVAVLACDHLHTAAPAVRSIVGALGRGDVVIPVVDGRQQTMHAAWRREVGALLRRNFDNGARSIRQGIEGLNVVHLLDGDPCWFHDADVPDDLTPS